MGFYDHRCMITGVSLRGEAAVMIPLLQKGGTYAPLTLGIKGTYNRLGALERVEQNAASELTLAFFVDQTNQKLILDEDYLDIWECYPITNIELFLRGVERNVTDYPDAVVWEGKPLTYALISRVVWDAVAGYLMFDLKGTPAERLKSVFGKATLTRSFYQNHLDAIATPLRELEAIQHFLSGREIPWQPVEEPYEHYKEAREFLREARLAFSDLPMMQPVMNTLERNLASWLA